MSSSSWASQPAIAWATLAGSGGTSKKRHHLAARCGQDARRHDPTAVRRAVGRDRGRGCRRPAGAGSLAIQRRLPEGAWVDAVDGLAQVQFEVLCGAALLAVEGDGRHRSGHDGEAMQAPRRCAAGRMGSCPAKETTTPPRLPVGEGDIREQIVECAHWIEVGRLGGRRRRRGVGARPFVAPRDRTVTWNVLPSGGSPSRSARRSVRARPSPPGARVRIGRLRRPRRPSTPGCRCLR